MVHAIEPFVEWHVECGRTDWGNGRALEMFDRGKLQKRMTEPKRSYDALIQRPDIVKSYIRRRNSKGMSEV